MKRKNIAFSFILFLTLHISYSHAKVSFHGRFEKSKNTLRCDSIKSKKYIISGTVQQTFSYCGGAEPTQEILDQLATPVAYPGKKFYIRKGNINSAKGKIVNSYITGKNGEFSISLSPGTYSIIQEEQLHEIHVDDFSKPTLEMNKQCLEEWWKTPYYILEVKDKNIGQLNFVFNHRCFISSDVPCITYTGPMPP